MLGWSTGLPWSMHNRSGTGQRTERSGMENIGQLATAAYMAKTEPTAWLDALPEEYGSLGQDPFKDGPHIFLVKFLLSMDCSQWTRLYPDTTLIGLRVFDWSTPHDNPEYH
ncbi:hypothetical protein IV203_002357 [Nitzschia inconspicua]|uniref:Uncharacterized protein n=1 Tax=Nitzschia inconspicua TaxID=303405 RepID=A0A9K3L9I0_9STRA|nr:hypothetical protein IV203_002357 [Nitzschia inconspicua]